MKNLVILLPILLVMSSGCTTPYQVIYKNPETVVNPGTRVRVRTKDKKKKFFKVVEVQPNKIVGKKVEFQYDEINTMEVGRWGDVRKRYFIIDSLEELKSKKVRIRTKYGRKVKFEITHVEDSILKGKNKMIGLSEIETMHVNIFSPSKTTESVVGGLLFGGIISAILSLTPP